MSKIKLNLNGMEIITRSSPSLRLIDFLREERGLTGTKEGCGSGECGACSVIVDGKLRCSCLTLLGQVEGKNVITIEGVEREGRLHIIQKFFIEEGAIQCGFCTPGFIMSTYALFLENKKPSRDEIIEAISGNLCRCTGYFKIINAIEKAFSAIRHVRNSIF